MSRLSVPQAAERLGVSPARVRQRIEEGSLVAQKVGGRWLVDLDASQAGPTQLGRPVSPSSVWWSLASAEVARAALSGAGAAADVSQVQKSLKQVAHAAAMRKFDRRVADAAAARKVLKPAADAAALRKAALGSVGMEALRKSLLPRMQLAEVVLSDLARASEQGGGDQHGGAAAVEDLDVLAPGFLDEALSLSRSSRSRAIHRFVEAVVKRDYPALLAWLSNRGARKVFVIAGRDLESLRADDRLRLSGVSHPDSGLEDPRVVEAYVSAGDLEDLVDAYWLERPVVDERPNVVLHVVPVRPPEVGAMLLAADLAEHGGPRELERAHDLLEEAINVLIAANAQGSPDAGPAEP